VEGVSFMPKPVIFKDETKAKEHIEKYQSSGQPPLDQRDLKSLLHTALMESGGVGYRDESAVESTIIYVGDPDKHSEVCKVIAHKLVGGRSEDLRIFQEFVNFMAGKNFFDESFTKINGILHSEFQVLSSNPEMLAKIAPVMGGAKREEHTTKQADLPPFIKNIMDTLSDHKTWVGGNIVLAIAVGIAVLITALSFPPILGLAVVGGGMALFFWNVGCAVVNELWPDNKSVSSTSIEDVPPSVEPNETEKLQGSQKNDVHSPIVSQPSNPVNLYSQVELATPKLEEKKQGESVQPKM